MLRQGRCSACSTGLLDHVHNCSVIWFRGLKRRVAADRSSRRYLSGSLPHGMRGL
jgi:hypothetical protein